MKQETENTKKRFKKKYLAFGIIGIFTLALISATLITNFFSQTAEFEVTNPITVDGETNFFQSVMGGDFVIGENFIISNSGSIEVPVEIIDNAEEGIKTTYKGTLTVAQKNVDFSKDVWTLKEGGLNANIEYTIVGDEFMAEVIEGSLEGYTLIYYKDNSDRFINPAKGILVNNVNENLPYETDGNADEYNYCETGEYNTCHGAKIWYIPNTAINDLGIIDWSQANNFLFETELIQYNSEGDIIIYPDVDLTITPEYLFSILLESGNYSIETNINPIIV